MISPEDRKAVRLSFYYSQISIFTTLMVQLKKARKEGILSEALLDRRSKLKRCASFSRSAIALLTVK